MSEASLTSAAIALFAGMFVHPVPAQSQIAATDLCIAGHPATRRADVTYAYLPPRQGMQRDHIWPLCGGGTDSADNIQYQPWPEARKKDALEWRWCEWLCEGKVTQSQLRAYFVNGEWKKDIEP